MSSPAREWWRRLAAVLKDKRSICLTVLTAPRSGLGNPNMESAVIRATSHDERTVDYKNAGRVFAWARASPSYLHPLMWAIAHRVDRTRSWPVALKSLLLAHGLLLLSSSSTKPLTGRLPFDLSDFRDRYSQNSWGFSAFVRAYFHYLDNRALLLSPAPDDNNEHDQDDDSGIRQVEKLQRLLDLLMQIRPYADGMDVGVILEAMDCAVIEIFEIYSGICTGIAACLMNVLGTNAYGKRNGLRAIEILRKAGEQSEQLNSYFLVCRSLGVLNAAEFPPVERIPEEDILDLERLVIGGIPSAMQEEEERIMVEVEVEAKSSCVRSPARPEAVVTKEWVVFEDEVRFTATAAEKGSFGNPFLCSATDRQWAVMMHNNGGSGGAGAALWNGNLIELL